MGRRPGGRERARLLVVPPWPPDTFGPWRVPVVRRSIRLWSPGGAAECSPRRQPWERERCGILRSSFPSPGGATESNAVHSVAPPGLEMGGGYDHWLGPHG